MVEVKCYVQSKELTLTSSSSAALEMTCFGNRSDEDRLDICTGLERRPLCNEK